MPESTSEPDLDTRIRDAIAPIFDLDDGEMIVDAIIVYTTIGPNGENLYYMCTNRLPHWKALGMLVGAKSIIEAPDDD